MSDRHRIRTAAVLGAGTMGAQIAGHLANAGVPTLLLDVTAAQAREGLRRAAALKPDPLYTREALQLIEPGGFDHDLGRIASADWIVEAIIEDPAVKRDLLERVDRHRRADAIVSSNTSGIPIASLAETRSEGFRRHWLGTHFFNPPRYLRLLEVIPTADTEPGVLEAVRWFADHRLGKGVVVAKDTPNFIANHIGLYGLIRVLRALEEGRLTVEEIDAVTGPALGRPRSATFRTVDIAGIDILAHVARNLTERLADDRDRRAFELPPFVGAMIERGWIGDKAGQGFYKKEGKDILALDPAALTYRPRQQVKLPALDAARAVEETGARIRTLFLGRDPVGEFLRTTLGPTLLYSARVAPEIAHSIDDVDRAMRWGFGWELGPFETWDAIGPKAVVDAVGDQDQLPASVAAVLSSDRPRFREGSLPPAGPGLQLLKCARERQQVVRRNAGASLVDIGDGVLAVEFHSKLNTLGPDAAQMIQAGLKEAAANGTALVVGNDAPDFSAGANIMLVLLEAQEGNWDEIDLMVRGFQNMTQALRYAEVPVVVATAGLALGGGCEIALHGALVQAAAESYVGLVEVGVGLIPAGGGTKEMLARAMEAAPAGAADLLQFAQPAFETIAFGKVSTSAAHALELGYLRAADRVTMNRERLIGDAKAAALELARGGYRPPPRRDAVRVGGETVLAALKLGIHLAWRAGRIGEHDAVIGRALAGVIAGGSLPHQTAVDEQYLLDLEREAFLRLCGEPRTLERMQYTLKTGKTLRN